jgi:ABC-type Fe3+ transport system permease subunit
MASQRGTALLTVLVILFVFVAVFLDRVLDRTVASSYLLAQRAWLRKGSRGFRILVVAAMLLAIGLTLVGILANLSR